MFTNLPSTDPIECTIRVYVVLVGCNHDMYKMTWTREITALFILIVITIIFSPGNRATAARSERIGKLYHKIIYLVLTQLVPQVDCRVFLRTFLFAFHTRRTQPNFGVSVLPSGDIFSPNEFSVIGTKVNLQSLFSYVLWTSFWKSARYFCQDLLAWQ